MPHIRALYEMIDKFYGRMPKGDLANAVYLYFKRNIYRKHSGMQMLYPYIVVEHLSGMHSYAAMNFIIESLEEQKQLRFIAKNAICRTDGTLDYKAFAMHEKTQTKMEKLYTMDIKKMNFNNGATVEDLNSKGAYAQLMPMLSQKEPKQRQQQQQQKRLVYKRKRDSGDTATSSATQTQPTSSTLAQSGQQQKKKQKKQADTESGNAFDM